MLFGVDIASMVLGGVAAGMVLFIVSVGLSVTMGLMGFVNLAHGAFAMLGGYIIVLSMRTFGIGFVPELGLNFPSAKTVTLREVAGLPLHRRVAALSRKAMATTPRVQAVLTELRDHARPAS